MAIWRTENALVLWGRETSPPTGGAPYGTPVIPGYRFGIHETCEAPDPEIEWTPYWTASGSDRSRATVLRGRWRLSGSVPDIRCQPGLNGTGGLADVLALGMGRQSGGVVEEGITATDGRLPSFTMQVAARDSDGNYQVGGFGFTRSYYGGKVNRMTLSASEGEEVRLSLDEIMFKDIVHNIQGVSKVSTGQLSIGTDPGLNPRGRFLFAGARIETLDPSVVLCRVKRFSLSLDNMLEPKYYLCDDASTNPGRYQVPSEIVEGKRKWSFDMEADTVDPSGDLTLFQYLLNQGGTVTSGVTGFRMRMSFASTDGQGAGSMLVDLSPTVSSARPGTVVTSGRINIPPAPAGYMGGSYRMDVDRVRITVPS